MYCMCCNFAIFASFVSAFFYFLFPPILFIFCCLCWLLVLGMFSFLACVSRAARSPSSSSVRSRRRARSRVNSSVSTLDATNANSTTPVSRVLVSRSASSCSETKTGEDDGIKWYQVYYYPFVLYNLLSLLRRLPRPSER